MTDEKTLQPIGVVSDLNIELFGLRINDEKNAIFYDGIARWQVDKSRQCLQLKKTSKNLVVVY